MSERPGAVADGRLMKVPGTPPKATPATRLRWFAAAHTMRCEMTSGAPVHRPASTVHAKRMGSPVTACGQSTMSWPKLFGVPFPVHGPTEGTCPRCAAVVAKR